MNAQEARRKAKENQALEDYFEADRIMSGIEAAVKAGRMCIDLNFRISLYTLEKLQGMGYEVEIRDSASVSSSPQTFIRW